MYSGQHRDSLLQIQDRSCSAGIVCVIVNVKIINKFISNQITRFTVHHDARAVVRGSNQLRRPFHSLQDSSRNDRGSSSYRYRLFLLRVDTHGRVSSLGAACLPGFNVARSNLDLCPCKTWRSIYMLIWCNLAKWYQWPSWVGLIPFKIEELDWFEWPFLNLWLFWIFWEWTNKSYIILEKVQLRQYRVSKSSLINKKN